MSRFWYSISARASARRDRLGWCFGATPQEAAQDALAQTQKWGLGPVTGRGVLFLNDSDGGPGLVFLVENGAATPAGPTLDANGRPNGRVCEVLAWAGLRGSVA